MLLSGHRRITYTTKVLINNCVISQTKQSKFLGVILDDKLSWIHHIDYIARKISKNIGILQKLKPYLDVKSLTNIYYAFVFLYLHYCNKVWGNTYISNLKRLITLQKRILRIIAKSSYLADTNPIFQFLKILTVQLINSFVLGRFMLRVLHNDLPPIFDSMFALN